MIGSPREVRKQGYRVLLRLLAIAGLLLIGACDFGTGPAANTPTAVAPPRAPSAVPATPAAATSTIPPLSTAPDLAPSPAATRPAAITPAPGSAQATPGTPGPAGPPAPVPVAGHPRLWLQAGDLPRLRAWAVDSNPLYRDGLLPLVTQAQADMDSGRVPQQDTGGVTSVDYPTEMYAELFAFMSLVSNDAGRRADYAGRARRLLMAVLDRAAQGVATGQPFRDPEFAVNDRSRWHGEAFGLTVDWIYPYLTPADKVTIGTVFLRWIGEDMDAGVTGHDHPLPPGVVNDPVLTQDQVQVRWAGNNYWTAHLRNIGLMALALDPADDPGNRVRSYLGTATGAWLYVTDYLMRHDSRGGLFPEGFEYSPQTVGYVAQFLLALHTAGQDDPARWGPQVLLPANPFWNDLLTAYLHSLSPAPVAHPDLGPVYQPAWYGDGQHYWAPDFIGVFGPLGLYAAQTGDPARLATLRWIESHLAPGGPAGLPGRANDTNFMQNAILYFLLFDPGAAPPPDPRPGRPLTFYAPGLGRILARTSWQPDAAWFTYKLSWNMMDHQNGDGNQFEFYRRGEWLTKERTGYDLDYGGSENHNTLALENSPPANNDPGAYRNLNWRDGSQWAYVAAGDPQLIAHSIGSDFVYAWGDATALYNAPGENATDIEQASRSIAWLPPDIIVVYDRAESRTPGRFKRFWLNLPAMAQVTGQHALMRTPSGQQLLVQTLLPRDAALTVAADPDPPAAGDVAEQEPMRYRLRVEAPGGPARVRFLHVLQGLDPGASAGDAIPVESTHGPPFAGALVAGRLVLFPVDSATPLTELGYTVPKGQTAHFVTGLVPDAGYAVSTQDATEGWAVTIRRDATGAHADTGGVLRFTTP